MGTFAGATLSPAARKLGWGDPAPAPKCDVVPCASRTLLAAVLRGQCRLTLWEPEPGSEPTGPRQYLFVDRAMCLPVGQRYCAWPLAVPSRLGPNVDGVVAGFKEVSLLLHLRDALLGPE